MDREEMGRLKRVRAEIKDALARSEYPCYERAADVYK
jgi:hypothetical protein